MKTEDEIEEHILDLQEMVEAEVYNLAMIDGFPPGMKDAQINGHKKTIKRLKAEIEVLEWVLE